VHDLDLKVFVGGERIYSNFGAAAKGQYSGLEDDVNNVEKVSVEKYALAVGDVVQVQVHSYGLSYAAVQKFAVVVTGSLAADPAPTPQPSQSPAPTPPPSAWDHRSCADACAADSPEYVAALAAGSAQQVCKADYSCTQQCGNYTYFKAACDCGLMDEYLNTGEFDVAAFADEFCCGGDACQASVADLVGQNDQLFDYVALKATCREVRPWRATSIVTRAICRYADRYRPLRARDRKSRYLAYLPVYLPSYLRQGRLHSTKPGLCTQIGFYTNRFFLLSICPRIGSF
jgi:hypothetical protein